MEKNRAREKGRAATEEEDKATQSVPKAESLLTIKRQKGDRRCKKDGDD